MTQRWNLEELRWYTRVESPKYHLIPWWSTGEVKEPGKPRQADMANLLLTEFNLRGRPQIRRGPWLWEVLRRHPDFQPILESYRRMMDLALIDKSAQYFEERRNFFTPWEDRGGLFIGHLAERAHLAWADPTASPCETTGPNEQRTCLSQGERDTFETYARFFMRCPGNFAQGLYLAPINPVALAVRPPESIAPQIHYRNRQDFGPKGPDDFTLGEYKAAARKHSGELLVLDIDQRASLSSIMKGIEDLLQSTLGDSFGPPVGGKEIRVTQESLERFELLDCGDFGPKPAKLTTEACELFQKFNLRP